MSAAAPRRLLGRSQQPLDDTEEVRNLRAKYLDRLEMIRELFPTWTDEDLLFALQDAGGDLELAVVRISEGQVEQFSSVKSKKHVKKESTTAPALNNGSGWNSMSSSTPSTFGRGRGGHVASDRGGSRGRGGAAVRGARGGRGGFRGAVGGRGGGIAPQVNGHAAMSPETVEEMPAQSFAPIANPTSGTSWAEALSKSKQQQQQQQNGAQAPVAAGPPPPAVHGPVAAPALAETADAPYLGEPVAEVQKEAASTIPAAEVPATSQSVPAVKVPAPAGAATKPAMSWAQIARKSEAPKPAPVAPTAEPAVAAAEEKSEAPVVNEEVQNAVEQASWTVDEPQTEGSKAVQEEASESAAEVAPAQIDEAPVAEAETAAPAAAESAPEPVAEQEAAAAAPAQQSTPAVAGPPGLGSSKPTTQRASLSQRASQRSRQDAAVVMPGGSSQLDNLGVQFGSLNFLVGEDEAADKSSAAEEPVGAEVEQAPQAAAVPEAQAVSPAASKPQPSLHERLAQSQVPVAQQPNPTQHSYSQQQQQAGPYAGFKSDAFEGSAYNFAGQQQQQQQQASQDSGQNQQPQHHHQDHLSGYGGFNSVGQSQSHVNQHSQSQASQQPQQGLQDYSMYGGLDTQRLAHFYGGYDQTSSSFGQRTEDKSQTQQSSSQPQQQQALEHQASGQQQHQQGQGTTPGVQQQQQAPQQQQFPGIMPYYYPHYYMPNQFQYAQPTAGYGQYPMYGQPAGQPQHPSKPGTPANLASPYSQAGPQSADVSAYGAQSHYGQTPSSAGLSASYDAQGFSRGMQGMPGLGGASDYSKIYSNAIPGLGGFLGGGASGGAPPLQTSGMGGASASAGTGGAGTPHLGSQQKAGASSGSALDSYRQFDANGGKASNQNVTAGQVNRMQTQGQSTPHQQQAQQHQQQQQQQYYHQYGAYGHQAHTSGSYGNYPYARQYWGQ